MGRRAQSDNESWHVLLAPSQIPEKVHREIPHEMDAGPDRDDRARVRRRGAAVPRGRARRRRALVRPQPPGRPVLVADLQPADGRVRREPREPDALRPRGRSGRSGARSAATTWSAPASRGRVHRRRPDRRGHGARSPTVSPPRAWSTSFRSSAAPPTLRLQAGAVPEHVAPERVYVPLAAAIKAAVPEIPDLPRHPHRRSRCTPTRSSPTGRSTWSA